MTKLIMNFCPLLLLWIKIWVELEYISPLNLFVVDRILVIPRFEFLFLSLKTTQANSNSMSSLKLFRIFFVFWWNNQSLRFLRLLRYTHLIILAIKYLIVQIIHTRVIFAIREYYTLIEIIGFNLPNSILQIFDGWVILIWDPWHHSLQSV